jgi:hypothetical protein
MSDAIDKDEKAALDAKVEKYRERSAARVAEIKGALINWLEPSDTIADSVYATNALLDVALDRHIEVHDANGFDLIEAAYQRALKRRQGRCNDTTAAAVSRALLQTQAIGPKGFKVCQKHGAMNVHLCSLRR